MLQCLWAKPMYNWVLIRISCGIAIDNILVSLFLERTKQICMKKKEDSVQIYDAPVAALTSLISGCGTFWQQAKTSAKRHGHSIEWICMCAIRVQSNNQSINQASKQTINYVFLSSSFFLSIILFDCLTHCLSVLFASTVRTSINNDYFFFINWNGPWLVADYVAVVGENRLYLLSVTNDRMEVKRTVVTGKNYTGIAAYGDSTLVLTSQVSETLHRCLV
jgi:hypothetical protein